MPHAEGLAWSCTQGSSAGSLLMLVHVSGSWIRQTCSQMHDIRALSGSFELRKGIGDNRASRLLIEMTIVQRNCRQAPYNTWWGASICSKPPPTSTTSSYNLFFYKKKSYHGAFSNYRSRCCAPCCIPRAYTPDSEVRCDTKYLPRQRLAWPPGPASGENLPQHRLKKL